MEQAPQPRGDPQLIAEFLVGRNAAFTDLFERYHRLVRVAIWNFFHNRDVIDDLCQETFLKAFTGLSSLKDKNRFKPWLLQIALRTCVDQQRRQTTERSTLEKTAREP